ncbi:ABC transporter permease [Segatella bryantii]|uniref:ABC-2 type transporter transmembrane domain-containing protein n=1 Tax=Segatella bryantii TaxID=77095 RepID=A0ABX4EHJ5_SEGBR|nr:ABC transporter permease [Segatella bryantii]MDR4931597.1 ABC transporter permease [Segatella bryantii]OYP55496.1 hypothetical protein CIK91_06465 [Segatella bryantii]UKK75226.1 ABC transporter permease [Segatella bryantii]UKK81899.1 ABC transporter permease [Segatella bryantii]
MKQLYYIIRREIMVKLNSRSFYLFALVTPLLFVLPVIFSIFSGTPNSSKISQRHLVGIISHDFPYDTIDYRNLKFVLLNKKDVEKVRNGTFCYNDYVGVVDMQNASFKHQNGATQVQLYMPEAQAKTSSEYIHDIESYINSEFVYQFGTMHGVKEEELLELTTFAKVSVVYSNTPSNKGGAENAKVMAYGMGLLLYIMFILFNNNIVKSIAEERSNKLAEVLCMFVKPGRLMIGKILGLGAASLVQLTIWLVAFFTYSKVIVLIGKHFNFIDKVNDTLNIDICSIPLTSSLLAWLIIYFIMGFLLNGSLSTIFAICSSCKSSSVPMVLSNMLNLSAIYFCMYAATNPNSGITEFASYFPLTSYLVIPAVLPYGISMQHIMISAILLLLQSGIFLFMTGKLYRRFLV